MSSQLETVTKKKMKQKIRDRGTKLIPFFQYALNYSKMDAMADFITGVTIGLIIIPQSVAYVTIVGLSPKIGLMSSVIGGLVYTVLGTIKEISIGPTATMALLTNQYISNLSVENIGFLAFCSACIGLFFSVVRLGFVVEFISIPVTSAFGTVVSLTVTASELKNFFGLKYKCNNFFDSLWKFYVHFPETKVGDMSLGIICTVILISVGKLRELPVPHAYKYRKALKKTLWLISMSRNAITIFLACLLTRYLEENYTTVPYELTDPVTPGFPSFRSPLSDPEESNSTMSTEDKIRTLGSGIAVVPTVSLLVHITIAKYFGSGGSVSVNHELISLSICNFLCSFVNGTPVAGAFSRSAVSNACGVRTPLSNFYATIMAFLALTYLTPYFRLIPSASLAAVIITAVLTVIDYRLILLLWRNSKKDFFVLSVALINGLIWGVEYGLVIGASTNLVFLIYLWARPSISIEKQKSEFGDFALVTPDLGLFYPAVDYLESQLNRTLNKDNFKRLPIAINCYFFRGFDYTAVKGIARIAEQFSKQRRKIIFYNVSSQIIEICQDLDGSVIEYFCETDENYIARLFDEPIPEVELKLSNKCPRRKSKSKANICEMDSIEPCISVMNNRTSI